MPLFRLASLFFAVLPLIAGVIPLSASGSAILIPDEPCTPDIHQDFFNRVGVGAITIAAPGSAILIPTDIVNKRSAKSSLVKTYPGKGYTIERSNASPVPDSICCQEIDALCSLRYSNEWQSFSFTSEKGFLVEHEAFNLRVINIYMKNNSVNSSHEDQQNKKDLMDLSSKVHLIYDEKNLLSVLSSSQGDFLHFLYDENNKICKIINGLGTVLYDASAYTHEEDIEALLNLDLEGSYKDEWIDKLQLIIHQPKTSYEYHQIDYFKDSQNIWRFSYRRRL